MSKKNKWDEKQSTRYGDFSFKIVYGLFFMLVAILPHLYKYKTISPKASEVFFVGTADYADLFTYYKSHFLLIVTTLLIVMMVYHFLTKKIVFKMDWIDIVLGMMALLMIISSFMSTYQDIVYLGIKGRFEGLFVWLCYLAIVFMLKRYSKNEKFVRFILLSFMFSGLVMAFIAILQANGFDVYIDTFLKYLIYPDHIIQNPEEYLVSVGTSYGGFASLFNPNYLGGYMAMVSMLTIVLSKEVKGLIYYGVPLSFMGLLISNSEAGLFGFSVAFIVYVYMLLQNAQLNYKDLGLLGIILSLCVVIRPYVGSLNSQMIYFIFAIDVAVVVLLIFANKLIKWKKPSKIVAYAISISAVILSIISILAFTGISSIHDSGKILLEDMSIENEILMIQPENKLPITLSFNDGGFIVKDKQEELIDVTVNNAIYYFNHEGVNYNVQYAATQKEDVYIIEIAPFYIKIRYEDNQIQYIDGANRASTLEKGTYNPYLYEHGTAFTERGMIWAFFADASLKSPIFGSGIETYVLEYPQNDHVAKYNVWGNQLGILVDKPHNMYLQIGFGFGLIVLLLYVVLIGTGIALGWQNSEKTDYLAMTTVLAAFVIVSLFNDSYIGVTVPLIVILGLSFSKSEHEV